MIPTIFKIPALLSLVSAFVLLSTVRSYSAAQLAREWGTYEANDDLGLPASVLDEDENLYVVGATDRVNLDFGGWPPNDGKELLGLSDAYIAKYSSQGDLIWARYFGGGGEEAFHDVALDSEGNVIAVGRTTTNSLDFVPIGEADSTFGGQSEGLVVKFSPQGKVLMRTYFGGEGEDLIHRVVTGENGVIYIAGMTSSKEDISGGDNPHQKSNDNLEEGLGVCFIAKLSTHGVRQWGTYYYSQKSSPALGFVNDLCLVAPTSDDGETGVAIVSRHASFNRMAVLDDLTTPNAHRPQNNVIPAPNIMYYDLVSLFSSQHGKLLWGTFYGNCQSSGDRVEWSRIAADGKGNVYVVGSTSLQGQTADIATPGAYQVAYGGGSRDGVMVKFTIGGERVWGTYHGGTAEDRLSGIAVNSSGVRIGLCGTTQSVSGLMKEGVHYYDSHRDGKTDGFFSSWVAWESPQLIAASYYGGSSGDALHDIHYVSKLQGGIFYLVGSTSSPFHIASSDGYLPNLPEASRSFAVKLTPNLIFKYPQ